MAELRESPNSSMLPLTFIRGPYEPLLIDHAEGAWLHTADGRKILDAAGGAVVTNIGQGREEIAQLMAEEVRRANYVVPIWSTPQRQRLVERLARWTPPGLTRFFFTSGGSEAVEAALKFALMYHKVNGRPQRTKIIAREASYHGNSIAALSVGGSLRRADYEHVLFDWPKIKPSYCYRCPWDKTYPGCDIDCANALEAEIVRHGADTVAAFIAEPMMGSAGGSVPPVKEYWPRLAEICRRHGVLLIADEVMTGFGRTGRRFAVDHWNVVPDILVGGKGLAGGYMPMGMIAVREELVEQCEAKGADFMFYTYSSHPTACAVAERVLEIMEREQLVERAAAIGARLGAQLKEELSGHPMVGDIRGAGMFWGVEVVRDRASRAPYPPAMKVASRVVAAGLKRGLFVYPATGMARPGGDAVMVTPPFVIGPEEIDYIVSRLRATLDDVHPNLQ
ncbi:MAG TPA: aspartate aminotransferase family protein [Candidatus Binataceae bacterium]|nr:aspartate aminotransferase family protein [Candidatus Binataceae bacterium]